MRYFGFMVSELTGDVDDLEGEFDYKPSHETCGFAFAKWFKTKNKRDESKDFIKNEIEKKRGKVLIFDDVEYSLITGR